MLRSYMHWTEVLRQQSNWVILDTETTGIHPEAEPVEIVVLSHTGETLLSSLVRPMHKIPVTATRIHGLTNKDVKNAPTFQELYDQLHMHLTGRCIITYNVGFDRRILDRACTSIGRPVFEAEWTCLMSLYSQYRGRRRPVSLGQACREMNVILNGAHRALGDCQASWKLLQVMLQARHP